MAKVTYVGTDDDPQTQIIREGGLRFVKGEPETVPDDHPWMSQFRGNPTFAVDGEDADVPETDEEETALRAELEKHGVKAGARDSVDTLRGKLAKAVEAGK
jgi:hypothetical protein